MGPRVRSLRSSILALYHGREEGGEYVRAARQHAHRPKIDIILRVVWAVAAEQTAPGQADRPAGVAEALQWARRVQMLGVRASRVRQRARGRAGVPAARLREAQGRSVGCRCRAAGRGRQYTQFAEGPDRARVEQGAPPTTLTQRFDYLLRTITSSSLQAPCGTTTTT